MRPLALALCALGAAWSPDARRTDDALEERPQGEARETSREALEQRNVELARAQALARSQAAVAAVPGPWRNLGPTDGPPGALDSGRVRAVVVDPRDPATIYLGTAGGGVFKTTNADADSPAEWKWTALTDDLPASSAQGNVSVGDLAISPTDSRTLWLGLGDPLTNPSRGFFLTHDGGATWERGGQLPSTAVWKILPLDGQTLLVATNVGLWRSSDGGRSFTQIAVGGKLSPLDPGVGIRVSTLARFPSGRILMGRADNVYPGTFIWFSDDGGLTWTRATANHHATYPSRLTIATSRASSTVAWAIQNDNSLLMPALLQTVDGGSTWNEVPFSLDTAQGWYNQVLVVDDDDPQQLFLGTRPLYHSTDGGRTFRSAYNLHWDQQTAVFWTSGGKKRLLVGNDGGLAVLKDPGAQDLAGDMSHNKGVSSHLVYQLGCSRDRTAIGTQDDGTRLAKDGTGFFSLVAGGDGYYTLIHPLRQQTMLFQINEGTYRVPDADQGGFYQAAGQIPDGFWGNPIVAAESDPTGNTVYRLGLHTVYRSTDFGESFTALPGAGLPAAGLFRLAVAPSDSSVLAVLALGGDAGIYVTNDGGATWTVGSVIPTAQPNSITIDSRDAHTLYVTSQTSPSVLRSRDQGKTWESLERNGYPAIWSYVVRSDPQDSSILYAANEFGLYWSRDAGASWARYGQGLPWVSVHDVCIVPGRTALRAGTYGRGAWEAPMPVVTPLALQLPNAAVVLSPGARETLTVSVNDAADLTVSGLPAGVTFAFDHASLAAAGTAALTFTAAASASAVSDVPFTVTAAHGADRASVTGRVSIVVPPSDFTVEVAPARVELAQGGSATVAVRTSSTRGAAQTVALSVEGLPGGVRGTLDRVAVTAGETATLTLAAQAVALEGDAFLVASGQSITHRALLHVRVAAPPADTSGTGAQPVAPAGAHGGCASAGVPVLALLGLAALRRRGRRPA